MTRWKFGLFILIVWFTGVWVGSWTEEDDVVFKTKTETVGVEAEPVQVTNTVEVIPESCLEAVAYAQDLWDGARAIDISTTRQLDIISLARLAVAQGDMEELNSVDQKQRALQLHTLNGAQLLAEAIPGFDLARQECNAND